jgi:uncharacterized membrane protein HdeD (DUF308 family)
VPEHRTAREPVAERQLGAWWAVVIGAIGLSSAAVAWLEPGRDHSGVILVLVAWFLFLLALLFVVAVASFERTRDRW